MLPERVLVETRSGLVVPDDGYWKEEEAALVARFLADYDELMSQERTGQVSTVVIMNTVLAGWTLRRRSWMRDLDPKARDLLENQLPLIARKYGLTRLWRSGYLSTLQRRIVDVIDKHSDVPLSKRFNCARCGRAIWNPLSVKRGKGPVCWHKRDPA